MASNAENKALIDAALQRSIELGETGIAVAAYHRGKLLVDAWAGITDLETKRPVDAQTLFPIFSVTKGITAIAVHIQADRGLIDVNKPVATYWPEFAQNGKEAITVEDVLSHRAGIPQMPAKTPEELADWGWMVAETEKMKPAFEPGKHNAYHVLVWGWLAGEIVRRTDTKRRPFDQFVQEEICDPLGVKNFHLGLKEKDLNRVATLYGSSGFSPEDPYDTMPPGVFPDGKTHNLKVMQQAVDPGAGGIADASSVAIIFAMLANGGSLEGKRLISAETVAGLTRPRHGAHDPERILPISAWFGAAGFWLGGEEGISDPLVGSHRDIVYSPGAGGSVAWADLKEGLAVAICHNNMDTLMVMEPERTFAPIVEAVRKMARSSG
jgi:CubicO group peptidase (beta-lactamase class C family)